MTSVEEDEGLSAVACGVYATYVKAAGGVCALIMLLLAFVANVTSAIFATVWLSVWLKHVRHANQVALDDRFISQGSRFEEDKHDRFAEKR